MFFSVCFRFSTNKENIMRAPFFEKKNKSQNSHMINDIMIFDNSGIKYIKIGFIVLLLIGIISYAYYITYSLINHKNMYLDESPVVKLYDFVKYKEKDMMKNTSHSITFDKLMVKEFNHFSRVACIKSDSFIDSRNTMYKQLISIPHSIKKQVIDAAIVENISSFNIGYNTNKALHSNKQSIAYFVWWDTQYTYPTTYSSCILISGISFLMADLISGYNHVQKTVLIGYKPCKCGYIYCEKCPVYKQKMTQHPVYKKFYLSLEEHDKLHYYMIHKAINTSKLMLNYNKEYNQISNTQQSNHNLLFWENYDKFTNNFSNE